MMASALEGVFRGEIFDHFLELVVGFSEMSFFHSFDVGFEVPHVQNILLFGPLCVMGRMIFGFFGSFYRIE